MSWVPEFEWPLCFQTHAEEGGVPWKLTVSTALWFPGTVQNEQLKSTKPDWNLACGPDLHRNKWVVRDVQTLQHMPSTT
ncbi:hypothetical protein ABBQ32_013673 [Trebouxia sp. C0010 RCD-2024]